MPPYTVPFRILLALPLLAGAGTSVATGLASSDPEETPLFAASMRRTFAEMEARAQPRSQMMHDLGRTTTDNVIVVEGTDWHSLAAAPLSRPRRPAPLDTTTDISCNYPTLCTTCAATTCGATCDATPTCRQYPSCHVPGPTCIYQTCDGGTTCDGGPTCAGVSCTEPGQTCYVGPTCQTETCTGTTTCDGTATCTGWSTCTGTCEPASCPTRFSEITVPEPGQIQLSFSSSAQLKYSLQYCTNFSAKIWLEACTTNGSGGVLTLRHTNGAALAFYRLLITTP